MLALKDTYTTQELMPILCVAHESSITRRAKKEGWQSRKRQGRGGGSDWIFSSLPQETQIAIRTAEERKALAACEDIVAPAELHQHIFTNAISNAILDDGRRSNALAKADLVRLYLEWQRKHGFTQKQKDAFVLAYLGGAWPKLLQALGERSWKSIERWKNQQADAGTVLALADKRGYARKGVTLLTDKHRSIILGQILHPNAPGVSACARRVIKRFEAENMYVPSEPTIRRFINAYSKECYGEWVLFREGQKAWNDKCAISILRDWSLVEVGDIVIADGHTLNFETLDENGKGKRMTLLLFYDGASNHPLGWEIMPTENVACISSAFRRTCLLLGKIPRVVYIDNGRAFRAKFFKGTANFEEAGFMGLYRDLGCNVIHAWPYHGQSKTIERFFGTFHDLEVFIPSYTGNSIARKPPRMNRGETMHRQLYNKLGGRPLTLEETHTAIAAWFCEYVSRPQYDSHLAGRTPAQLFEAGRGPGVDASRLTLLMLQKQVKTIYKDGIKHYGRWFWHENLANRRHPVLIRYDDLLSPFTVLVYDTDGNFLCEARDREHYKIASGMHPAAKYLGTDEQVQDLSDAIDLKRGQEKIAGANFRHMLEAVVLPEAKKSQAALTHKADLLSLAPVAPKAKALTSSEIAEIEAAKEKARVNIDTKKAQESEYIPSALKRFANERERYDYLFGVLYEQGVELIPQDEIWMRTFEESPRYQSNYKRHYDAKVEFYSRQQQVSAS